MTSRLRALRSGCSACSAPLRGGRPDEDLEEEPARTPPWPPRPGRGASIHRLGARGAARSARPPVARRAEVRRDLRLAPDCPASRGQRGVRAHAGLAIGATIAAFRIVDAVLLRPLPVADADRLFYLQVSYVDSRGEPDTREDFDYPPSSPIVICSRAWPTSWWSACRARRTRRLRRPAGRAGPAAVRLGQCVRHVRPDAGAWPPDRAVRRHRRRPSRRGRQLRLLDAAVSSGSPGRRHRRFASAIVSSRSSASRRRRSSAPSLDWFRTCSFRQPPTRKP